MKIPRPFDSHVHLLMTGSAALGLSLHDLKSPTDLSSLKILKSHFRGDWLTGFGWNQHQWPNPVFPSKAELDSIFPDFPVAFIRADGHAIWLNSKALQELGFVRSQIPELFKDLKNQVIWDSAGQPTGIFLENAMVEIQKRIPFASHEQNIDEAKEAVRVYHQAGFTHVRDMTSTAQQWRLFRDLEDQNDFNLFVYQLFVCDTVEEFPDVLKLVKACRGENSKRLRAQGVKFFLDGALGSEGALMSQPYSNGKSGTLLWKISDLESCFEKTWAAGFDISLHAIGDQSVHLISEILLRLKSRGIQGRTHLEHAQVIRPDTFENLNGFSIEAHMQPCHYLSDRVWLKNKLQNLYSSAFPWREFEKRGVPLHWGSDAPIEPTSIANTRKALLLSQSEGIASPKSEWTSFYSHPDSQWGKNSWTEIDSEGNVQKVYFENELIVSN